MFEKIPNPVILPGDGYGVTEGRTVDFSSNGKVMFVSGSGGATAINWQPQGTIYDLTSGAPVFKSRLSGAPDYPGLITRTTFSFNNLWLAVGTNGGRINIYSMPDGYPEVGEITYTNYFDTGLGNISALKYSYDGKYIAVSGSSSPFFKIYKVNPISGAVSSEITGIAAVPTSAIYDIKFSQDNKWLIVVMSAAVAYTSIQNYIYLYNLEEGIPRRVTMPAFGTGSTSYALRGCEFSPNSKFLYISDTANNITTFDITSISMTVAPIKTGTVNIGAPPAHMGVSFGSKYLCIATTTPIYFIRIYSINETTGVLTLETPPTILPSSTIYDLQFSFDGKWLAIAHTAAPFITVYNTSLEVLTDFKKVVDITPEFLLTGKVNIPIDLKGTVSPNNATTQVIHWSIVNQGGTSSEIIANRLYAKQPGTVRVRATILYGTEE